METGKPAWLLAGDLPFRPAERDLLAFFGIPPDGPERLDANIEAKRKHWHQRSNGLAGHEIARRVKKLINEAAEALKRGATPETDRAGSPEWDGSVDDLWREIEELVFGDQLDRAIQIASAARAKQAASPTPHAAYAWVVAVGVRDGRIVRKDLLAQGLEAARKSLAMAPDERVARVAWESSFGLLVALERHAEALKVARQAEALIGLSPGMRADRATLFLTLDRADEGMGDSVRAVAQVPDDTGIRGQCASALITRLALRRLPISDAAGLRSYTDAVNTAAWCAQGVPDAEDLVRPHRLWATQAAQRVFAGSWELRSLVAVITAFLALPLYNRLRSQPVWKIFLEGPEVHPAWRLVADSEFVRHVHQPVNTRIPWVSPDGQWPLIAS